MGIRTWLYQTLINMGELQEYYELTSPEFVELKRHIFQGESAETSLMPRPFMYYTIGVRSPENLSEERDAARQFFTIYVHDDPADYTRIDDILGILRRNLRNSRDPASGVMTTRYLESSTDLDDQTLKTIMRYIRFQAIMEE